VYERVRSGPGLSQRVAVPGRIGQVHEDRDDAAGRGTSKQPRRLLRREEAIARLPKSVEGIARSITLPVRAQLEWRDFQCRTSA